MVLDFRDYEWEIPKRLCSLFYPRLIDQTTKNLSNTELMPFPYRNSRDGNVKLQ